MSQQHFLFLCHPDHGHVIPNLAVVAELVDRGHRVTYLTAESMRGAVADTGATVLTYDSRYRDADFGQVAENPLYLLTLLLDESARMLRAADELLSGDVPDHVVYDTSILYAGRVLSRKWGRPATQLIPVFASNPHFSYLKAMYAADSPAADSPGSAAPAAPPVSDGPPPWVVEMLGRIGALTAEHGLDVAPQELWWEVPDSNVVTIPRSFQFAGDTFDERFAFVGPCVGDRSFLGDWAPPASGLPVVLVSLGAVFNQHEGFFRACLEAFAGQPWHVVMTVADGMDPASLGGVPDNVEVHRWVPHATVLEHAVLAVTHGGMGTVMEALRSGVPMVVVPTSALDRPTADRIVELGLGASVPPEEMTAPKLLALVRSVIGDADITAAAARMRDDVRDAGGAVRAADEIEKFLARSR
ncbi:macrolide family glycosyltransferase [Saccharothrix hoggarensis]|uniref:Macrolide family glycosyltransferase n=1 Tax=Saccharothrix hoggarensis TaxID=913853 RepID=A0ABW3QX77_9PSEU